LPLSVKVLTIFGENPHWVLRLALCYSNAIEAIGATR
jgi:hypothetical protein